MSDTLRFSLSYKGVSITKFEKVSDYRWEKLVEYFNFWDIRNIYKFIKTPLNLTPEYQHLYVRYSKENRLTHGFQKILKGQHITRDISYFIDNMQFPDIDEILNCQPTAIMRISRSEQVLINGRPTITDSFVFQEDTTINKKRAKELLSPLLALYTRCGAEIR